MSPLAAQAALNARFKYKADETGERWKVLTDSGEIEGDCEDYSLTLIWLSCKRSWFLFFVGIISLRFVIWYCRSPKDLGHAVMWVRGYGWTDNIKKGFVTKSDLKRSGYKILYPYLGPLVFLKFALRPLFKIIHKARS